MEKFSPFINTVSLANQCKLHCMHYYLPIENECIPNGDLKAVKFYFFVKKDSSLMWEVAPGAGNPFFLKNVGVARRTSHGVNFVNWYCLGY